MKNKLLISTFLSVFLLTASNVQAANFTDNQTVDSNKVWTIRFTDDVGFDDAIKQGITIIDSKGNVVNAGIQLGQNNKTLIITAPQDGYTPGESYTLNVGGKTHSNKGKALKNKYMVHFSIKNDTTKSDIVTFKDKNLEQAVRDRINKPTEDIYKSDVENITSLEASGKNIQDISGIENLSNLEKLYLGENMLLQCNQISDITPLKGLIKLQSLDLGNNQIADITPLKELTNLQKLYLWNNKIEDIASLGKLTNLVEVHLGKNKIANSNLNYLSNLKKLSYLDLSSNAISDIISLKNLSNLQIVDISYNQVSDLSPLGNLTNLQTLSASNNKITDISILENLVSLKNLSLSNNGICDIQALSKLISLGNISLANNKIHDIQPLSKLINLTHIYLGLTGTNDNCITDFSPIANIYPSLENKDFELEYNDLKSGQLVIDNEWKLLYCVKNNAPFIIKDDKLKQVYEKAKQIINSVITANMSDLQKETAVHDYIVKTTKYDIDNYLKGNTQNDEGEAYSVLINHLSVCAGYSNATELLMTMAGIECIPVEGTANGMLGWDGHAWNIVKIDGKYYQLDVTWDDPAPDGQVRYDYFNISDNQISKNHKWDTNLYPKCDVDKNDTNNGNTNNNSNTTNEDSNNSDTIITFKDKNLEKAIRDKINKPTGNIYKKDVEKITSLYAQNVGIQDISGIENLTNLQVIRFMGNQINDISPLKGLVNLQQIYLSANKISDISLLKGLTNLQVVYLDNNPISDISVLKELPNLQYLCLYNTKISDADKQSLKNALPQCNVQSVY